MTLFRASTLLERREDGAGRPGVSEGSSGLLVAFAGAFWPPLDWSQHPLYFIWSPRVLSTLRVAGFRRYSFGSNSFRSGIEVKPIRVGDVSST
jgi:hypothetical protein